MSAALDEYARTGWSGFTMEGVVRRAGVGKSAAYRRWQRKEQLLIDSLEYHAQPLARDIDTGSLSGDLAVLAQRLAAHFTDPIGWVTMRIAVDAASEWPELGSFGERVTELHRADARALFDRAAGRGELDPSAPFDVALECLFGSIFMRILSMTPADYRRAPDAATAHLGQLVDLLIEGLHVAKI